MTATFYQKLGLTGSTTALLCSVSNVSLQMKLESYSRFFFVDNHTMASHSAVSIRILDVNDNPPELATPYEASICENAKPGQVRVLPVIHLPKKMNCQARR